jgi:hypothetical protein
MIDEVRWVLPFPDGILPPSVKDPFFVGGACA